MSVDPKNGLLPTFEIKALVGPQVEVNLKWSTL